MFQEDVVSYLRPEGVPRDGTYNMDPHGLKPLNLIPPTVTKVSVPHVRHIIEAYCSRSKALRVTIMMDIPYIYQHVMGRGSVAFLDHVVEKAFYFKQPSWAWLPVCLIWEGHSWGCTGENRRANCLLITATV